jgi:hypothetical protein
MDAVRHQVDTARNALAQAVAKAGLTADPLGQALQALSLALGAQLSLHEAAAAQVAQLDDTRADRQKAIVAAAAPHLAEAVRLSVRSWNRAVHARTFVIAFVGAVAGILVAGALGFAIGWQAGEASGLGTKAGLAAAMDQIGPEGQGALAQLARQNDLAEALSACRRNAYAIDGRRACALPVWLDAPSPPARTASRGP